MYPAFFIDGLILAFLLLQTFLGFRRGLLWQAAGVASLAFGVILGWFLAPALAPYLTERITSDLFRAKLIVFLFVLASVGFTLRLIAAWAEVRSESGVPSKVREARRADDRILGGIFGAMKGCVLSMLIIAGLVSIYPDSKIWPRSNLAGPLATAGLRLLPAGAIQDAKRWALESASDMQKGLDIR
ncbi:MAG TPA: CvpA family protein [Planctomycetota bacterium]